MALSSICGMTSAQWGGEGGEKRDGKDREKKEVSGMEVLKIEDTGGGNMVFKIEMKWMQKSQLKVPHRTPVWTSFTI